MNIKFACFSPHPPILLPSIGSEKDRAKVKKTIGSLENLSEKLKKSNPDKILISSLHPDWGFDVPLYFLAKKFKGRAETYLIGLEPPDFYFEQGKKIYARLEQKVTYAFIASGDLSYHLKQESPYGFNSNGSKFDKALISYLKKKDVKNILKLDEKFPGAGGCGLRSFCFLLGVLEKARIQWQPEILSYEGPFGIGYLVANLVM